ncbi:hypothetical protein FF36_05481 [Frankia torreyi]|uniref:Uncharacterized protein n=1 Tax=Frankia torreyi TaxID=1856 RepID=A0A0D8B8H2_9ACTN|nr:MULTISPECIES: hypothetical protein [Frankia]KJE20204.1 hypothetical protein FF36_05481 [Frankia torreyi]KQM02509.1 hypothetical protein FF86_10646 [Frankia sp. CpI1-P]
MTEILPEVPAGDTAAVDWTAGKSGWPAEPGAERPPGSAWSLREVQVTARG